MRPAEDWDGELADLMNQYSHQPELTGALDEVGGSDFTQSLINEIVLWKVNRCAPLHESTLSLLNQTKNWMPGTHKNAVTLLEQLLKEPGIDLAMASTLLRFRNPKVFQIIDRHAFRAFWSEDYPLYAASSIRQKRDLYFEYIDRLIELSKMKNIDFHILDRVLYVFDKKI